MQTLTIGQLAREAGTGVETIRFYERLGLIKAPTRKASGYRQFNEDAITHLRFIKQAQRLGFTLREVKDLLALKLDPRSTRAPIRERAVAKIADIEERIQKLKRMKKALTPLVEACDGKGSLEGCPILAAFAQPHPTCHVPPPSAVRRK